MTHDVIAEPRKKRKQAKATMNIENQAHVSKSALAKRTKAKTVPASSETASFIETLKALSFVAGLSIMVYVGYWFVWYVHTLHDNQLWFTNIAPVEREISFRTECGLYYSYFKQLVNSPSFSDGYRALLNDNATEHGRTINVVQRFNIWPEISLAWLYETWPGLAQRWEPIFFYIYAVFSLNGLYVGALFALTWMLCGGGSFGWTSGLLCSTFFIVNLNDATRVFFTVNLRESFGFPVLWCQIFVLCLFLKRSLQRSFLKDTFLSVLFLATTYLFALSWQFNQFIMLTQAASVYASGILHLVPEWQTRRVLILEAVALLLACASQYLQPMLLGSLLLAFAPAAALSLYLCRHFYISGGIVTGGLKLGIQLAFTLLLTALARTALKWALNLQADDHIFKFLKGKFGFADPRDFESRIYLCHGAFVFLDNEYFTRTSVTLLFPLYLAMLCASLFVMGKDILSEWCCLVPSRDPEHGPYDRLDFTHKTFYFNRRPEIAYLVIQSAISGLLAMMALRMKYLWTPHMCVLAAVLLGDVNMWHALVLKVRRLKNYAFLIVPVSVILCLCLTGGLAYRYLPKYREQMNDLKEFYDPDTVELMYWIGNNTEPDASFAGSMQLLAGIKCCTGRHVTNHPHFEDKELRDRTLLVYQAYGRRTAREVYDSLRAAGAQLLVLEDSICLARSDGCSLPDLIDLHNGHAPGGGRQAKPSATGALYGLRQSSVPRFCDEVRHLRDDYGRLFHLVLANRTFRVYRLQNGDPTTSSRKQ